jgi:5-oxoprolinase (ATP-hydrolysing) subunit A
VIDLSADLGEGSPGEEEIWPLITSANVACGGHVGDDDSMREAARLAREHHVRLGAHPSYPDRENFGRKSLDMTPEALRAALVTQLEALRGHGPLEHVKPHGALYNDAHKDRARADVIIEAMRSLDPHMALVAPDRSQMAAAARAAGTRVIREAFADRRYESDGSLTPRSIARSTLTIEESSVQARLLADEGVVIARDGSRLPIAFDTLCIHADMPGAVERLRAVRAVLFVILFSFLAMFAAADEWRTGNPACPEVRQAGLPVLHGYIVGLPERLSPAEVNVVAAALEREHGVKVVRTFTTALNALHVHTTDAVAKKLVEDARVAYVEENAAITLTADAKITRPVDADRAEYAPGWSLHRITHRDRIAPGTEGTYPFAGDGAGVIAYVFDSGVWAEHPDLQGRVEDGYDTFIPGSAALAHVPCPVDTQITAATRDACPPGNPCLAGAHGTMAASLIGGSTFGVAPGVTIVPVRVSDCTGNGQMVNLIAGLEWVLREHLPAPDAPGFNGAVINMSIHIRTDAGLPEVRSLKAALARVIQRGAVVFTGAGNTPLDACGGFPSGFAYGNGQPDPHVISVSGVNHTDARDCTSALDPPVDPCTGPQFGIGRCVDLFAPAVDMRGAGLRDPMRLTAREGTSWASPHAAGAAARLLAERAGTANPLYRSATPHETSDHVWRALRDNATRGVVQNPGRDSANRLLYIGAIEIASQPRSVVTRSAEGTTPLTIAVANPPAGTTYSWRRGTFADFAVVQESSSPTYDAPAGQTASYWVRVSHPHTPRPVTADSVLATVTHCPLADALPVITATPAGNLWRLQVAGDTDATQYQWFVGSPGDTAQPLATTTAPELDVLPQSTTDYWVRVIYPGCNIAIDSGNYATAGACHAPVIREVPSGTFVVGTEADAPSRPFTLDVLAEGTGLTYQWYRLIGGVAEEIPGATRTSLTLDAAGGPQSVFVRVTSSCGPQPSVDSAPAHVSWVSCDLVFALARHPNRKPGEPGNNQMAITNVSPPIVYVPMGRSVALTARPVDRSQRETDATLTWVEDGDVKATGRTYVVRNVVNATGTRTLDLRMAQRGSRDCDRIGFVRVRTCGRDVLPLITRFPVSDGTGVARLEVREANAVVVEWRTSEHDDSVPAVFVERLQPGDRDSTRQFPPGTRYWARVTAADVCNPDEGELTEDTEVYTAQACSPASVLVRDPVTGGPVDVENGHTINVPLGGSLALSATTSDVRWNDSLGGQSGSTYFAEDTASERLITLESPAGCFAGSVTLHPASGCAPPIWTRPVSTTAPRDGKGLLAVTVHPSYENATIEWWEGEHVTTGEPVARNVTSFMGEMGKTYWVRVIAACGDQLLVEDSPLASITCGNCRTRSVRH